MFFKWFAGKRNGEICVALFYSATNNVNFTKIICIRMPRRLDYIYVFFPHKIPFSCIFIEKNVKKILTVKMTAFFTSLFQISSSI